jgi:hypothetical protein
VRRDGRVPRKAYWLLTKSGGARVIPLFALGAGAKASPTFLRTVDFECNTRVRVGSVGQCFPQCSEILWSSFDI